MEDSKFNILMNSVEEMIVTEPSSAGQQLNEEPDDTIPVSIHNHEVYHVEEAVQKQDAPLIPSLIGDDDEIQHDEASLKVPEVVGTPADLIQTGLSFLGKLAQTLSSPEATQQLLASIVQKDEKDGKTYLKIPVENEKVIENALTLLSGIFSQKKM
jgi:hypothetical protein